jgi:hypothetical protein
MTQGNLGSQGMRKDRSVSGLAALTPLWVGGLVLLQLWVIGSLPWLDDKRRDTLQYVLVATLLPALLVALAYAGRATGVNPRLGEWLKIGLSIGCGLAAVIFVAHRLSWVLATFISGQAALAVVVLFLNDRIRLAPADGQLDGVPILVKGALHLLALAVGWSVSQAMIPDIGFAQWVLESRFTLGVCLASLVLVTINCCRPLPALVGPERFSWLANSIAVIVLALASLRCCDMPRDGWGFHHWGVWVSPSEVVRQGGWLLWEVPSQYGFLSALVVAWLPIDNIWQALYTVNCAMQFFVATLLFFVLRWARPGLLNWGFAFLAAMAAVFFVPGIAGSSMGPSETPSTGAMRYGWCFALVAVALWDYRTSGAGGPRRTILWTGSLTWLCGCLWSCESSIFCTAIWAPTYGSMLWRRVRGQSAAPGRTAWLSPATWLWAALPPALFVAAVGAIVAYYRLFLGEDPDWRVFADYCMARSFFSLPLSPGGIVLVLVLLAWGLATVAAQVLEQNGPGRALTLSIAVAAALWAGNLYFVVSRSHELNGISGAPYYCLAAGTLLYLVARPPMFGRLSSLVVSGVLPVMVAMITVGFGNADGVADALDAVPMGYRTDFDNALPTIEPAALELIRAAKVNADDPLAYIEWNASHLGVRLVARESATPRSGTEHTVWVEANSPLAPVAKRVVSQETWLPMTSVDILRPLTIERQQLYVKRYLQRRRVSGWLLVSRALTDDQISWLYQELEQTHVRGRTLENAQWRLTWYDAR